MTRSNDAGAGASPATDNVVPAARPNTLSWMHFPAGPQGFLRAPVLLMGTTKAMLLDGGFTLADGRSLVEAIRSTGRKLETIYVSQSDPDYYFSLGPVSAAFPDARVLAAPATVEAIEASVQKKLEVWGPQLKDNGPQTLTDVIMPKAFAGTTLDLEGCPVEIVTSQTLPNRRYLYVPSLDAVFGGVLVFSGVHVWTADTSSKEARASWIAELDAMAARHPAIVVPGHMAERGTTDASSISYTRQYLVAFEEELAQASNSASVIAAMSRRYPDAGMKVALETGAKVAMGEMKWG